MLFLLNFMVWFVKKISIKRTVRSQIWGLEQLNVLFLLNVMVWNCFYNHLYLKYCKFSISIQFTVKSHVIILICKGTGRTVNNAAFWCILEMLQQHIPNSSKYLHTIDTIKLFFLDRTGLFLKHFYLAYCTISV